LPIGIIKVVINKSLELIDEGKTVKGARVLIGRKRSIHSLDGAVDLPVYPIGVVAEHFGVSGQTLRLYESKGLVRPARRNGERYYSRCDIRWLECLRRLIHEDKVSVEGVRHLLHFAPCWRVVRNIWNSADVICGTCPVHRKATRDTGAREQRRPRSEAGAIR
jgi:MerR family transcriptional regulator/heat shock protein HspR